MAKMFEGYDLENIDDVYDLLIDYGYVQMSALNLILGVNGYNMDTMEDVIYFISGYRDVIQLVEAEHNVTISDDDDDGDCEDDE